jgi:hypothetical protein
MIELADDAAHARELGRRGRETVITKFDPIAHAERLSEMLSGLLERRDARQDLLSARLPGEARREA